MNVSAQTHVISEIPAIVVGVFIDDNVVPVPKPAATVVQIKRRDAEVEAAKPEAARTTSGETPMVTAAEAAGEAAMLPGVIEVEAGIIASGVVSNPLAVVVDVRGLGMAFFIATSRSGRRAMRRRWTVLGNISAANGMTTASVATVLRQGGERQHQGNTKDCVEKPHWQPPNAYITTSTLGVTHRGSNTSLTILCRLRYRKVFGSSVVARLMVLASSSGNQRAVFLSQPFFNLGEFPMSTYFPKQGEIVRKWYVVDADGQTLGRLASQVARILMGKENPQYTPFLDTGDHVIVINAEKIRTTGVKAEQKVYQHYTGYPGGLRTEEYKKRMVRKPEAVIEAAVKRMLPKNKLAAHMLSKLNVYKGDKHPHQAQKPQDLKLEVRA